MFRESQAFFQINVQNSRVSAVSLSGKGSLLNALSLMREIRIRRISCQYAFYFDQYLLINKRRCDTTHRTPAMVPSPAVSPLPSTSHGISNADPDSQPAPLHNSLFSGCACTPTTRSPHSPDQAVIPAPIRLYPSLLLQRRQTYPASDITQIHRSTTRTIFVPNPTAATSSPINVKARAGRCKRGDRGDWLLPRSGRSGRRKRRRRR